MPLKNLKIMTVQIEIDEDILAEVDDAIKILEQNREDVFREAFRDIARKKKREAEVAKQYREAYRKNPVQPDEFDDWEEVRHWED